MDNIWDELREAVDRDHREWPVFNPEHAFAAAVEFMGAVAKPFSVVGRPVDHVKVRQACVKTCAILIRLAVGE